MAEKIIDTADNRLGLVGAIATPENAESIIANAKESTDIDLNPDVREYMTSSKAARAELISRGFTEKDVQFMSPNDLLFALRNSEPASGEEPEG